LVRCAEGGTTGVFNATGETLSLADHVAAARGVASHTGPVVGAAPAWIREHGVHAWMCPTSLPLWLDDPDWFGMCARDTGRARAAGLVIRPLHATLVDTLAWEIERHEPGPHGAGLTDDEERHLLALLASESR